MKIAVLVSGDGTNLQALIDSGLTSHIAKVIGSKPDCYALKRAEKAGIATAVAQEADELPALLGGIDLIVLAGYLKMLKGAILEEFRDRIINVHPSLIPAFCGTGMYGLKVHEAALKRGVKLTGATVHMVDEVLDGGRILAQKAVEVQTGDTPETLQKRVMEQAEQVILPQVVWALVNRFDGQSYKKIN